MQIVSLEENLHLKSKLFFFFWESRAFQTDCNMDSQTSLVYSFMYHVE